MARRKASLEIAYLHLDRKQTLQTSAAHLLCKHLRNLEVHLVFSATLGYDQQLHH